MKFEVYLDKNTNLNLVCQCDKVYRLKFSLSQVIQILNRSCDVMKSQPKYTKLKK